MRAKIAALGGHVAGSSSEAKGALPGSRPRNASSLVEALKQVLGKKAMTVADVAKKVVEAGYQATAPSFRQIVNIK